MKVHLQQDEHNSYDRKTVLEIWEKENLIPDLVRKCDGLMMTKDNIKYFTDDMDEVTCKRCIKMWNKFVREQK